MRVWSLLVATLLLPGHLCDQEPTGQFGAYHWHNKQLRLPDGDTLTVYRVKLWRFSSGEPSALQIEYEPPTSVADTAAMRRLLRRVWPAFAPYVEYLHLRNAIVTATNLTRHGAPPLPWTATFHSYGFVLQTDTQGQWSVKDDLRGITLPPSLGSDVFLIYEATGAPFGPAALQGLE